MCCMLNRRGPGQLCIVAAMSNQWTCGSWRMRSGPAGESGRRCPTRLPGEGYGARYNHRLLIHEVAR